MRRFALMVFVALALGGCASVNAPPAATGGSFLHSPLPGGGKAIADDTARKLAQLYPPANTRLNLQHAATDPFGAALVAAIRQKGYALAELKAVPQQASPGRDKPVAPAAGTVALDLSYMVDQPLDADLFRITVVVGRQSLSRLYLVKNGALASAGSWVRKE